MKKILFFGMMAALLLGTASCSSDMEPSMGDDMVRFTIELPGNIDSRAISDGLKANQLTVAVYDEDGNELPDIRVNKDIPHQTTVEFKLVKGQKYSFAFWAQADGAPYTFDTANKKVTVNYENAKSNDEKRDAFYAYRADLVVTGPYSETIYLHRPFAQLNYGASDYQDAIKAGVKATKSAVTVKNAATTFNLATGESTGSTEAIFTQEILPNDPETLTVEDKTYQWMAMNYFLVPNNEATIETSLKLYEDGNAEAVRDITVPNVPVQKNHRTNIVGNLFTEDVNFLVIIDERFDQPDNNVYIPYLTDADAIAAAIMTPGAVVNVAPGMELNLDLRTIAEGVTINGNGSKLILNQTTNKVNSKGITLNGFTIDNIESGNASIVVNASGFSLKDCVFEPSAAHTFGVHLTNMSEDGVYNFDGLVYDATADRRLIVTECKGTVNISNSILKSIVYPISTVNIVSDCDINVSNTQLIGWTSFNTGSNHVYHFDNCYFGKLNYGYFRPYGGNGTNEIILNHCTFSDDYDGVNPALGAIVRINDSAFESGNALTKDNIVDTDGANGKVYIDGTLVFDSEAQ